LLAAHTDADAAIDSILSDEAVSVVRDAVDSLPEKTRAVIFARFFENKSLQDAGKAIGVTKERARQIEADGMEKLSKRLKAAC